MQTDAEAESHSPLAPRLHQACHICVPRGPEEFSSFSQLELGDVRMLGGPHQDSVRLTLPLAATGRMEFDAMWLSLGHVSGIDALQRRSTGNGIGGSRAANVSARYFWAAAGLLLLVLLPVTVFPGDARPLLIGHPRDVAGRRHRVRGLEMFAPE